jgi:ABC-type branched-subunit amino acid transport system substrate-binding protein
MHVLGRVRAGCLCAALAALASGGCTAANSASTLTASGSTLTIYVGTPVGGAGGAVAQDVLDAEQLAFAQSGGKVGTFTLQLSVLNGKKLSDNARTAIQDTSAIAYLGEIRPGDSGDSLGITNAQQLLQVTPTDTALELTQTTAAIPKTPNRYYQALSTYGRTFARVTPNSAFEAKAQAEEMQTLGVHKLYLTGDRSDYGRALASAIRGELQRASITISPTAVGADGAFFAGRDASAASRSFASVLAADPGAKLFGPSALAFDAAALEPVSRNLYISQPGFLPSGLTAAGQTFVSDFTTKYGHAPAGEALFGYEAMKAVLSVLSEAGTAANNRATVVKDFFAIRNRSASVLGPYSINADGDTSLASFVFSRLRAGKLVPFAQVQG